MYPILFTIGALNFKTLNLFFVISFLATAFVFWKRGREEHYSEIQLFDGFLLSYLFGLLIGRLGFILINFSSFGFEIVKWFNMVSFPGSNQIVQLIATAFYLFNFAKKKKWDTFEVLDFWATATSIGMFFVYLGHFFNGSLSGKVTSLPWGIVFPGAFEKRHPLQIYYALFYCLLFIFQYWSENKYRTFEWYRAGKRSAQTGFIISVSIIFLSAFSLIMSFISIPTLVVKNISLDVLVSLGALAVGCIFLFMRSGRKLSFTSKKTIKK